MNAADSPTPVDSGEADAPPPENEKPQSTADEEKLLAEIKKLKAETLKAETDTEKARADISLAPQQIRLQRLSIILNIFVPIVSVLAVLATIRNADQTNQRLIESDLFKSQKEEWKPFKDAFDEKTADQLYKQPTFSLDVSTWAATPDYRGKLLKLSKRLLSDISSFDAFQDLWSTLYEPIGESTLRDVVFIDKSHSDTYDRTIRECGKFAPPDKVKRSASSTFAGPCDPTAYTKHDLETGYSNPAEIDLAQVFSLYDRTIDELSIIEFISEKLSAFLKKTSTRGNPKAYDISDARFRYADLQNVDFSKMRINQTRFFSSNVKGAILTASPPNILSTDFWDTPWWEAEKIDGSALSNLMEHNYPGSDHVWIDSLSISKADYSARLNVLCKEQQSPCSLDTIKYGSER